MRRAAPSCAMESCRRLRCAARRAAARMGHNGGMATSEHAVKYMAQMGRPGRRSGRGRCSRWWSPPPPGLAAYFARRVVTPEKQRVDDLAILAVIADGPELQVVLEATPDTIIEGTLRAVLQRQHGPRHHWPHHFLCARAKAASPARSSPSTAAICARPRRAGGPGTSTPTRSRWAWSIEDVTLELPGGPAPAWLLPAPEPGPHLGHHGPRPRRHPQRGPARRPHRPPPGHERAADLLPERRRRPRSADGRYGLGVTEWADVEVAIDFAAVPRRQGRGARSAIPWAAPSACRRPTWPGTASMSWRMVLDAPVINWVDVLAHQAQLNRIPNYIGRYGQLMLSHPLGRRITGLAAPVDLKSMDWVSRAIELRTPSLDPAQHRRRLCPLRAHGRAGPAEPGDGRPSSRSARPGTPRNGMWIRQPLGGRRGGLAAPAPGPVRSAAASERAPIDRIGARSSESGLTVAPIGRRRCVPLCRWRR